MNMFVIWLIENNNFKINIMKQLIDLLDNIFISAYKAKMGFGKAIVLTSALISGYILFTFVTIFEYFYFLIEKNIKLSCFIILFFSFIIIFSIRYFIMYKKNKLEQKINNNHSKTKKLIFYFSLIIAFLIPIVFFLLSFFKTLFKYYI